MVINRVIGRSRPFEVAYNKCLLDEKVVSDSTRGYRYVYNLYLSKNSLTFSMNKCI